MFVEAFDRIVPDAGPVVQCAVLLARIDTEYSTSGREKYRFTIRNTVLQFYLDGETQYTVLLGRKSVMYNAIGAEGNTAPHYF